VGGRLRLSVGRWSGLRDWSGGAATLRLSEWGRVAVFKESVCSVVVVGQELEHSCQAVAVSESPHDGFLLTA
jgi:hypothetical protein